jgi:hypothetical protein
VRSEELIVLLAREGSPVRPLSPPGIRFARWAAFAVAVVALLVYLRVPRQDFPAVFGHPAYLIEFLATVATALLAAAAAFVLSVPGAERTRLSRWVPVAASGAWLGLVAWALVGRAAPMTQLAREPWIYGCMVKTMTFAFVPSVVLFWMLRQAAPLDRRWSAGLAALAALSLGAVGTQIDCPIDRPAHLLLWHLAPVPVLAGLVALAGHGLLRWMPTRRP